MLEDYVDAYNGGCDSPPGFPIQSLQGGVDGELSLCGHGGTYLCGAEQCHDSDWFAVYKASDPFQVTGSALYPTHLAQVVFDPEQGCGGEVTIINSVLCTQFEQATLELIAEVGEEVWIKCETAEWEDVPEYAYTLEFQGVSGVQGVPEIPPPSPAMTWGAIKHMFR
ncbi:hypothetical protein ACFL6M_06265 [Candidatus Eisenbacteria bacterium]|uniref:Uncharacterized protein n=1 Tax=Eiseniibacteriota bacterium TaxID=2212470 RepID=A0ABV6YLH1_UNCEI